MPEAVLKFKLPEEEQEHRDAIEGTSWKLAMWDLDQILRKALKYGSSELCEDSRDAAFEYIRKELYDSLDHYKLSLLD
jgi:hypothetical protein